MKSDTYFPLLSQLTAGRRLTLAIVLALGATAVLQILGAPLQTAVAPQGILSYEFAGDLARAQAIIASWDDHARLMAAFTLGLDFLYPLLYATAIALSCRAAAPYWTGFMQRAGSWLAASMAFAATLDYVENIALVQLLFGSDAPYWAPLAWGCAAAKFTFVILGILYALIGGLNALRSR